MYEGETPASDMRVNKGKRRGVKKRGRTPFVVVLGWDRYCSLGDGLEVKWSNS